MRWKYIAIIGISALFLSLLIGILTGNALGIVLLRSILIGIIFAIIAGAGNYVINRYIPELSQLDLTQKTNEQVSGNVDIVLPEEDILQEQLENKDIIDNIPMEAEKAEELQEEIKENIDEVEIIENENEDYKNVETEEESGKLIENELVASTEDADNNYDKKEAKIVSSESEKENKLQNIKENDINMINDDELDVLPDMEMFESSFSPVSNSDSNGKPKINEYKPKITTMKNSEKDAATYAKAVRTIIKRDEEGSKKYGR